MATTPVQFKAPTGLTLTLSLYPYGSDTIANTGGDAATEKTNNKGLYSADVTEALTGRHDAKVTDGSGNLIANYEVDLADDTDIKRCYDPTGSTAADGRVILTSGVGADQLQVNNEGALTRVVTASTVTDLDTDAITADSLAADAVTEIQSGLATASALSAVSTRVLLALPAVAPNASGGLYIIGGTGVSASLSADDIDDIATAVRAEFAGDLPALIGGYANGVLAIVRGASYDTATGNALVVTKPSGANWPDLTDGWTVTIAAELKDATGATGETTLTSTATVLTADSFQIDLTVAQTDGLDLGPANGTGSKGSFAWVWSAKATKTGAKTNPLLSGSMNVAKWIGTP